MRRPEKLERGGRRGREYRGESGGGPPPSLPMTPPPYDPLPPMTRHGSLQSHREAVAPWWTNDLRKRRSSSLLTKEQGTPRPIAK